MPASPLAQAAIADVVLSVDLSQRLRLAWCRRVPCWSLRA
jgi:hypothetical protein